MGEEKKQTQAEKQADLSSLSVAIDACLAQAGALPEYAERQFVITNLENAKTWASRVVVPEDPVPAE